METVANCVIPYIHDPGDRNSVSLVCCRWYEIDCMTRKHVTVHLHYAHTPLRLSQRFPFLESLTLKGYPSRMDLRQKSGVYITPWIREISSSFKCLKSLHIRNVAIHDSDLELLARTRGKDLKVLKIVDCEGISENGLMHISKGCNELRTLCLDHLDGEKGCVKWLQELALRNTGIETFSSKYFCDQFDVKDVALLVKNCSKSLVSLNVCTSYIDDNLRDAFSHAVKLEHFNGVMYREDMEYGSFKFPSTIRCLGIYDFPEPSLSFVDPLLNQLRELQFYYVDVEANCQCSFVQMCPNLEVLDTEDVCGDKGLQVISQFCKKLRKLTFRYCSGTHVGLIAVAQGCRNLEFLDIELTDISNEALECIGTNLKNLRALYLCVCKHEDNIETITPLDNGFRAMLIGCTKLERLCIYLYEEALTDVGLGFIGKYGINLRYLSLANIGGSDERLRALSMGCPRLRKLEMQCCNFSEEAIARILFNVHSLRYIWVLNDDREVVSALTRQNFGSTTMEAQVCKQLYLDLICFYVDFVLALSSIICLCDKLPCQVIHVSFCGIKIKTLTYNFWYSYSVA